MLQIFVIVLLIATLILILYLNYVHKYKQALPEDYIEKTKTGGPLEQKYMHLGNFETDVFIRPEKDPLISFIAHYPKEMVEDVRYPVVLLVNSAGMSARKQKALLAHIASWGFIAVGNDDLSTADGFSAHKTVELLMKLNKESKNVLYGHIDETRIGIMGMGQGAIGTFNAISEYKDKYACAIAISPIDLDIAPQVKMNYDPHKDKIPTLLLSKSEDGASSKEGLGVIYRLLRSEKILAFKPVEKQNDMLYAAMGYVIAFFLMYLRNDLEALHVFTGDNPELLHNACYEDARICLDTVNEETDEKEIDVNF